TGLVVTACADDSRIDVAAGTIDVDGATPQTGAPPTGDPNSPDAPQISGLYGPSDVQPGQAVHVRLYTYFADPSAIGGGAVVIEGVEGWFRFETPILAAAVSDPGSHYVVVPVVIGADATSNDAPELRFALLNQEDHAGAYATWSPQVGGAPVACPESAACESRTCGADPICATSCGTCLPSEACSTAGSCEAIGAAWPDLMDCSDR